jgi:hypothetical protein
VPSLAVAVRLYAAPGRSVFSTRSMCSQSWRAAALLLARPEPEERALRAQTMDRVANSSGYLQGKRSNADRPATGHPLRQPRPNARPRAPPHLLPRREGTFPPYVRSAALMSDR